MPLASAALEDFGSLGFAVLFAVVGVVIVGQVLRARAEAERHRIQVETQRTVMAAVMDAQNNFLNNIVYFQTRAEAGGPMTKSELSEIDCAIREAQMRLIEIAESDDFETRDIGTVRAVPKPRRQLAG